MALFKVPVQKATIRAFTEQVEIEASNYNLRFRFNQRDGKWRMTIEFEGDVLVRSLVLIESEDLLEDSRHVENLPPGTLKVRDLDGLGRDPDGVNFGDRVVLLYLEAA